MSFFCYCGFLIKKELNVYGDNIVECFKFIKNIQQTFKINEIKFSQEAKFLVPKIILKNSKFEFNINLFANYDKWKNNPIDHISKKFGAKLKEYPDVIVFEKKNNTEKILCAIEYSNALLAGNQAWQRQGRCYSFSDVGINFFYVIELGGKELDKDRNEKSTRYPNPTVILSYFNFINKYKKKFIPIFSLSSNSTSNFRDEYKNIDSTEGFKNCLFDTIIEGNIKQKNIDEVIDKTKKYFYKLYNQANNINKYNNIELLLNEKKNSFDFFSENDFKWKKSITIQTTPSLKKTKLISEKYGHSIISKNLPFVLIPEKNKNNFINDLKDIYSLEKKELDKINNKKNLILCFILGFKPRGDDARPDRGLNPLIKMIFNDEASIFSIIYGPATASLWKMLNENPNKAKESNGLIRSIMEISDLTIIDSINYPSNFKKLFNNKISKSELSDTNFVSCFETNKINEHDIDNSIFLFFRFFSKKKYFESMINPPGGDWSNIDLIDDEKNIYRWTNLPRVSGEKTKRPDHIYIFNTKKNMIALIIESKYRHSELEENIGERLKDYVKNLIKFKPNCIKSFKDNKFLYNKRKEFNQKIILKSAVAYYAETKSSKKDIINNMNFLKTSNLFEISYDKNYKVIINFFTNNLEIFDEFSNNIINNSQINFSVIKI